MFLELHMIQNFVPSNLNRDEANNPKDCEFGGYRRARISSQCIKRAIRTHPLFQQTTQVENGKRTQRLAHWLQRLLLDTGRLQEEVEAVTLKFTGTYAKKMDKEKTKVLTYVSPKEIEYAIDLLLDNWADILPSAKDSDKVMGKIVDDVIKKYKKVAGAPDIALFGRMLADQPATKLEAACQVAHAISTHAVSMEMDFFTAVDDLRPDAEVGAGMMGYTGFNSACFYRYACIDWQQLVDNLKQDQKTQPCPDDIALARRTVEAFLRAAVAAVPSGMKNAWGQNNPVNFLFAVVRQDGMGWSLANAFVRPVRPTPDKDLVTVSVKELELYWERLCTVFGTKTLSRVAALPIDPHLKLTTLAEYEKPNLEAWIMAIVNTLPAGEETV
jgi:CRISPR system Cascade subunit CasC